MTIFFAELNIVIGKDYTIGVASPLYLSYF